MKIKTRRYDEKFTGKNAGNEVAEFQMLLKENVILREFNEFKGDYPFHGNDETTRKQKEPKEIIC